jgi:transcriptional regulator with XRE-family HTH domain
VRCTRQAVSLWETGTRMPSPKTQDRIAKLFAPSMDVFLRGPR